MNALILRHILLYKKDKMCLLITGLSVFVILSLYFLFIRSFTLDAFQNFNFHTAYNEQLVDSLMIGGLIVVIGATTALGMTSIYVKDKEQQMLKDFFVAPIARYQIVCSYIIAGILISFVFMIVISFLFLCVLRYSYHISYQWYEITPLIVSILLTSIFSNLLLFFITFFIQSQAAYSAFSNLFGVTIGFFVCVYIPFGYYPEVIQSLMSLFPLLQISSIVRTILTNPIFQSLDAELSISVLNNIKQIFAIDLSLYQYDITMYFQYVYVVISIILLFVVLMFFIYRWGK